MTMPTIFWIFMWFSWCELGGFWGVERLDTRFC